MQPPASKELARVLAAPPRALPAQPRALGTYVLARPAPALAAACRLAAVRPVQLSLRQWGPAQPAVSITLFSLLLSVTLVDFWVTNLWKASSDR
jgi:hypothetical protein